MRRFLLDLPGFRGQAGSSCKNICHNILRSKDVRPYCQLINEQLTMSNDRDLPATFRISPLIRLTLLSLYVALTVPLPFLSQMTGAPVPPALLWAGLGLGGVALYGALSERVIIDEEGIHVNYPGWVPRVFRRG